MNVEDAKKALEDEAKRRVQECSDALKELMEKYDCAFDVVTILRQGKNPEFVVNLIPRR